MGWVKREADVKTMERMARDHLAILLRSPAGQRRRKAFRRYCEFYRALLPSVLRSQTLKHPDDLLDFLLEDPTHPLKKPRRRRR